MEANSIKSYQLGSQINDILSNILEADPANYQLSHNVFFQKDFEDV